MKKFYSVTAGLTYRYSSRRIFMPEEVYSTFCSNAVAKAARDSEQNDLVFYEKKGADFLMAETREIEMEETRRGNSLTYISKNRPALIEEAKNKGFIADSILHSHPVVKMHLDAYTRGTMSADDLIETYAPLSVGDFIFMERWKDPMRGVVVATPEKVWGPYFWLFNRENLDVALIRPRNFCLL